MGVYWATVTLKADSQEDAQAWADWLAAGVDGTVLNISPEPPQGSMVVGKFWEDEDR